MKFENVTGGTVSGSDCFILFKSPNMLHIDGCSGLILRDIHGCGAYAGRLRQTWEALKFIWCKSK